MRRALVILALAGAAIAAGTAGQLDTTFDTDGLAVRDFGYDEMAYGVAVQSDGRVVAAGHVRHGGPDPSDEVIDFAVARFSATGGADGTFGSSGVVTPFESDGHGNAIDVRVDAQDRIVAVGNQQVVVTTETTRGKKTKTTTTIEQPLAVVRLTAGGALDSGFGVGGAVLTYIPGADRATANSVVLLANGDILVAGQATVTTRSGKGKGKKTSVTSEAAILLRYDSDGALDTSFGDDGIVVDDIGDGDDSVTIRGLGVQSDGKIVLAGRHGWLRRYDADGTLDTTFGDGGHTAAPEGDVFLGGLAIDGSDRILVCGYRKVGSDSSTWDGLVSRYGADGASDWSFLTGISGADELRGVEMDGSGGIVSGGHRPDGSGRDGFALRLLSNGTADTTFGTGGFGDSTTPGDTGVDLLLGLTQDGAGRILLCGARDGGGSTGQDWLLARYLAD